MSIARSLDRPWNWPAPVRRYHSFVALIVTGMIAVGLSGFVCNGIGRVAGKNVIAGDSQSAHLSPARCADLMSWHPQSSDCSHAELAHHFDEVVQYREVMLPAGMLLAVAYSLARRRWFAADTEDSGIHRLRLRLGAGAFAIAAFLLFGSALVEHSTAGLGRNISDGTVAGVAALACGVLAFRGRAVAG